MIYDVHVFFYSDRHGLDVQSYFDSKNLML